MSKEVFEGTKTMIHKQNCTIKTIGKHIFQLDKIGNVSLVSGEYVVDLVLPHINTTILFKAHMSDRRTPVRAEKTISHNTSRTMRQFFHFDQGNLCAFEQHDHERRIQFVLEKSDVDANVFVLMIWAIKFDEPDSGPISTTLIWRS